MKAAKAMGLGGALFVAVYVPAFIATALVRPPIELAIALIIAISLLIATLLIFLYARARSGFAEFGFCIPSSRYVGIAFASGLTLGLVAAFLNPADALQRLNLGFIVSLAPTVVITPIIIVWNRKIRAGKRPRGMPELP